MNENPAPGTGTTFEPEKTKDIHLAEDNADYIAPDQDLSELQKQMKEIQETNALLKAAILNQGINVGKQGNLVGEVDKYTVDPANYSDPTPRLQTEARLKNIAFDHNYELQYAVEVSSYETKTGINMREPRFRVQLNRIVLDEQGNQTAKRYVARKLVFHEDPQAAMIIARDNGLDIDKSNEKEFLNEMRYLRVRDWLFDIFWPKPATSEGRLNEEVINNTLVTVFTKSSIEPSEIPFDQIKTKVV